MRKPHAVSQLERHYNRIRGEIQKFEEEIVAAGFMGGALRERRAPQIEPHREMLGHIEACIRLFQPDWTSDHTRPVRSRKKPDPDKWGKLLNMAYDVLRAAPTPISSADLLDQLWRLDRVTTDQRTEYRARLTTLMRGQERVGAVRSYGSRPLRWSIIKPPAQVAAHKG